MISDFGYLDRLAANEIVSLCIETYISSLLIDYRIEQQALRDDEIRGLFRDIARSILIYDIAYIRRYQGEWIQVDSPSRYRKASVDTPLPFAQSLWSERGTVVIEAPTTSPLLGEMIFTGGDFKIEKLTDFRDIVADCIPITYRSSLPYGKSLLLQLAPIIERYNSAIARQAEFSKAALLISAQSAESKSEMAMQLAFENGIMQSNNLSLYFIGYPVNISPISHPMAEIEANRERAADMILAYYGLSSLTSNNFKDVNRATSEQMNLTSLRAIAIFRYSMELLFNRVFEFFGLPDRVRFGFGAAPSAKEQMEIDSGYISSGVLSSDEVRGMRFAAAQ